MQSSSNVPENCGIVNMEQYRLKSKRYDLKNAQILTPESTLNRPGMAEVILACGENEEQNKTTRCYYILAKSFHCAKKKANFPKFDRIAFRQTATRAINNLPKRLA